jgi:hypothetical protein
LNKGTHVYLNTENIRALETLESLVARMNRPEIDSLDFRPLKSQLDDILEKAWRVEGERDRNKKKIKHRV